MRVSFCRLHLTGRTVGLVILICMFSAAQSFPVFAQGEKAANAAQLSASSRTQLGQLKLQLNDAMLAQDAAAIERIVEESISVLGDQAGLPEAPDELRAGPPLESAPLRVEDTELIANMALKFIEGRRWWKIGLDPTRECRALREVATIMESSLLFSDCSEEHRDAFLSVARNGGDFLVWTQSQAETGVFPFPAVRNGDGRPFQVAEAFQRKADQAGRLGELTRNGWLIDDLDDGGLQFDNALAGVAVLHLYEKTADPKYLQAAQRSADWTITRRIVTNWNYNSFSVYLLAEVFRVTKDQKYLDAAKVKAKLGVIPGQLKSGSRQGRWADPHNARPAYHYIMIRGLAALAQVTPENDPDRLQIAESLRLALLARNPDFERGILNTDSTVEALCLIQRDVTGLAKEFADCGNNEVLTLLNRYAANGIRLNKPFVGPAALGLLLQQVKK